jgi:hypothetical protein
MPKHHAHSLTERTASGALPDMEMERPVRLAIHTPHTSHGASHGLAAHWITMLGGLLPLALSELIPDPAKYRKATRIASIGTTVAYEVLYTVRELKRREKQEAKLAECRSEPG